MEVRSVALTDSGYNSEENSSDTETTEHVDESLLPQPTEGSLSTMEIPVTPKLLNMSKKLSR